MARHPADFKTYEDYVELCQRYQDLELWEMLRWAQGKRDQAKKEGRHRV